MLLRRANLKINKSIKNNITIQNVIFYYCLAKTHKLIDSSHFSFEYIERCYPMVVETQNFLYLDLNLVLKILSSSELNIHSEVQVFNAAKSWLEVDSEQRNKHAKQLLQKVHTDFRSLFK